MEKESGRWSIAWAETVAVRLGLLTLSTLQHVAGKTFFVWTDNTTSQSAITKRKSRDEEVNEEWKHIQRLFTELSCDIAAKHVADALSRGYLGDLVWYDEVRILVLTNLRSFLRQVFPPKSKKVTN